MAETPEVTEYLLRASNGDTGAWERLAPLVYDELHRLAEAYLRRERNDHTLQPTALVHEAYLRLVDQSRAQWRDRAHFLAIAANSMRRILVDHARRHRAQKRGSGAMTISLDEIDVAERRDVELDDLDAALTDLARVDARPARVVELRFFGGLSIEEAAEVLGVSPATVKRDWVTARAWLYRELSSRNRDGT